MFWPGFKRLYYDETKLNHVAFAGVGWGKTHGGVRWLIHRVIRNFSSVSRKSAIIAPTHRHLKRQHYPVLSEYLRTIGMKEMVDYRLHKQDMVVEFMRGPFKGCQIFLVSMENWQALVAWEFDSIWWDEPGFGNVEVKDFVDQRTGRSRGVQVGQVLYTGVVQIPNWYFDLFGAGSDLHEDGVYRLPEKVEDYAPGWGGAELVRFRESEHTLVLHASSFENKTLKPQYFIRLWQSFGYKESKFRAHVIGEAIAVNTDAVYPDFEEAEQVGDYKPFFGGWNPELNLCFDFNVGQMTALVVQVYEGNYYVVWENGHETMTTQDACKEFLKAFPPEKYGRCEVRVFGDHSGYARSAQLKTRDGSYSIIKNELQGKYASLRIEAPRHSIVQETRVSSTNRLHGEKRLYADRKCRKLITGWRKTSWDKRSGKIAKGSADDHTHAPEALDYYTYVELPPIDLPMVGSSKKAAGDYRTAS